MNGRLLTSWTVVPLGELARVYSGGTPSRGVHAYWGGGIPWVTTAEIDAGFITSVRETITEAGLKASAARIAPPGTLLLAMYGQGKTRGKAALLQIPAAMNQACAAIEIGSRLDGRYLLYYLASQYDEIRSMSNAGSQENLSGALVRRIPIAVPPIHEQRAIAALLGDADDLIAQLERKIAKKQGIKQGMIQQLLTGRTRLPGFDGPWREAQLGSLLKRPPRYGVNAAAVPISVDTHTYIRITDIDDSGRFAPQPRVGVWHPNSADYLLRDGELVFARTGASVGKSYLYDAQDGALVYAGFLINIAPDPEVLEPKYLAFFAQTAPYWDWVSRTSVRSGQPGINGREYAQLQITAPGIREQQAIIGAVQKVDEEIRLLGKRLTKAEVVRQGMLQQLLTGRTRLPVKESAA